MAVGQTSPWLRLKIEILLHVCEKQKSLREVFLFPDISFDLRLQFVRFFIQTDETMEAELNWPFCWQVWHGGQLRRLGGARRTFPLLVSNRQLPGHPGPSVSYQHLQLHLPALLDGQEQLRHRLPNTLRK